MAEIEGVPAATVTVGGVCHELVVGQSFVFGRAESCEACLDAADVGISRRAGSIDCIDRVWFVTNRSQARLCYVIPWDAPSGGTAVIEWTRADEPGRHFYSATGEGEARLDDEYQPVEGQWRTW